MLIIDNKSISPYQPPNEALELVRQAIEAQHRRLGQLDLPRSKRTRTAINYGSHIQAFFDFLQWMGYSFLPTANHIEEWRDGMIAGTVPHRYEYDEDNKLVGFDFSSYSPSGVNARLAAINSLLLGASRNVLDPTLKLNLKDWATVRYVKGHVKQDMLEEDEGIRLTLEELKAYFSSIQRIDVIGLRDKAVVALLAGAGLRVDEATHLTMKDVFRTKTDEGIPAIHVRKGKGNKSRLVALSPDSWVLETVQAYAKARGIDAYNNSDAFVLAGYGGRGSRTLSEEASLSNVKVWKIVRSYPATHDGISVTLRPHDLRRTYASLCHESGMEWNSLRANLGHRNIAVTQGYVGRATRLTKRVPDWSI